jgi:uncharacterized membrane protein
MWWRIFYGTMRIILGFWLLNLIDMPLSDLLHSLMSHELVEDPNDLLYRILNSFLQLHPLSVTYFLSAYLFFWGATDIVLSASLLRHKLWAFPASLTLIGFFVGYELYRLTETRSLILLFFICVDAGIWWLIKDEWKKTRRRRGLG